MSSDPTEVQTYQELYRIALTKIARGVTPQAATKAECAQAKAMVEAYFRGALDRERIDREIAEREDH
jgi:hypothetical protein